MSSSGQKIGYARVSTRNQSIDAQVAALKELGCTKIFSCSGSGSGKSAINNDKLNELLNYVREGDIVYVTKIDRLGRSLSKILSVINALNDKRVGLVSIVDNIDTLDDSPLGRAMLQLILVFAELERTIIADRMREGREKSGNVGGRPKLAKSKITAIENALIAGDFRTKAELARRFDVSRSTVGLIARRLGLVDAEKNGGGTKKKENY